MTKFKKLEWVPVYGDERSCCAISPVSIHGSTHLYIYFEHEKYWANWDMTLAGTTNLQSLKDHAQQAHEAWLNQWIEIE